MPSCNDLALLEPASTSRELGSKYSQTALQPLPRETVRGLTFSRSLGAAIHRRCFCHAVPSTKHSQAFTHRQWEFLMLSERGFRVSMP